MRVSVRVLSRAVSLSVATVEFATARRRMRLKQLSVAEKLASAPLCFLGGMSIALAFARQKSPAVCVRHRLAS